MSNSGKIILGVFVAIVVTIVAYLLLADPSGRRFNWKENYYSESKEPYGTFVISKLLDGFFEGREFTIVNKSLSNYNLSEAKENSIYVFIGEELDLSYEDSEILSGFIYNGGQAFISAKNFPSGIFREHGENHCLNFLEDQGLEYLTECEMNFNSSDLRSKKDYPFRYLRQNQPLPYYWDYISYSDCDSSGIFSLGYFNEDKVNYIKISYGDGAVYFHANPIVFSNLYLIKERGFEYAGKSFSFLEPGDIYWDEYNKFTLWKDNGKSPLHFILSNESLRWGWYILLSMVLVFILFRAKRVQRVIPVFEKNRNTSLEYIQTIGRLYFLQGNHRNLAVHKMKLFLSFLRNRFGIQSAVPSPALFAHIHAKSSVPLPEIQKIFSLYQEINMAREVSSGLLREFHFEVENFYKKCK